MEKKNKKIELFETETAVSLLDPTLYLGFPESLLWPRSSPFVLAEASGTQPASHILPQLLPSILCDVFSLHSSLGAECKAISHHYSRMHIIFKDYFRDFIGNHHEKLTRATKILTIGKSQS